MKKISSFILACLGVAAIASCSVQEIDTDQLSDENITLVAIAPNPVARGGMLRIVGSQLQKVEQVEIPGVSPITEIEVVSEGRNSEIRVKVPVDGPEIGPVTIVSGGIRISTKTELEYSEPIILEGFSPASAMPGDVITVKGDYMNNIHQVSFEGGATVNEFVSQSRYELKVKVPSRAISGKIILSDVDESNNPDGLEPNLFYSENELVIGDPTVKETAKGVIKAGSEVSVSGSYLDMIKSVRFGEVEGQFSCAADGKSIKATLPASAVDGDVILVSYAGKEFKGGSYETLVPSGLAIKADDRYKAGSGLTVSGKDLDLVTGASLAGTVLEFSLVDGKISATIPATAVDGSVTLTLENGKTVETEAIELVKPIISSLSPLELFAGDENITVSGTDLDLVTSAKLGGKDIEIVNASESSLELVTALTSVSGTVVLGLANGVSVESAEAVKVNYHSLVIVTEMPSGQHIGEEVVLKGSNFDLVENIFIGDTKVTSYSLRTPEEVRFLMPWCKKGDYEMSFHLFNGDVETVATPISVLLERNIVTIWEGNEHIAWSGMTALSWGGYDFSSVKPGTVLTAYFELDADQEYWQIRFSNGSWSSIPSGVELAAAGGNTEGNIPMTAGATCYSITLTAADIDMLLNQGGLVMTGTNYTLTKLTLTTEISQETTLWEGEVIADDWGNQPYLLSDGGKEFIEKNVQPGMTVYFYFTPIESDWKVEIVEGHWGPTYASICAFGSDTEGGKFTEYDLEGNGGRFGLKITQEIYDKAITQGGWGGTFVLNGDNIKCTKVTVF